MGHDLVLDDQELQAAADRIDTVVADLEASSERRGTLLAGIGDDRRAVCLRDAIAAFDATWRVRREGLQDSLSGLADVLRQIDRGFDDADRGLLESVAPSRAAAAVGRVAR